MPKNPAVRVCACAHVRVRERMLRGVAVLCAPHGQSSGIKMHASHCLRARNGVRKKLFPSSSASSSSSSSCFSCTDPLVPGGLWKITKKKKEEEGQTPPPGVSVLYFSFFFFFFLFFFYTPKGSCVGLPVWSSSPPTSPHPPPLLS